MDITKIKSKLNMLNLYFSRCEFIRKPIISDTCLNTTIDRNVTQLSEHHYSVELTLKINNNDLNLLVVANADFSLDSDDYSNEKAIMNKNTVAIMFPFIRSQVSLMTSQPGMTPITLPAINVNEME
ncbi:MAG: protein-export chaperone SecB [Lachnospiraceae bacterium]|nr:protein-export chaperone SecB [Lachnospiraceae bacterium]